MTNPGLYKTGLVRCVFFAMLNEAAVHCMPAPTAALPAPEYIVARRADTAKGRS
jgi:hypothetical protein